MTNDPNRNPSTSPLAAPLPTSSAASPTRFGFIRRVLTVLAAGYVTYFFSETVFWGRFNPETPRGEFIISWFAYSIMTYMLLTIIDRFRVRSLWALFLAAAAYGWICEGILAQTMYLSFPINLSWTGLAWHAIIVVCGGWYWLRWTLAHGSAWQVAKVAGCLGLFWGAWSVFWWNENGTRTPIEDYIYYATVSGTMLVGALFVENKVQPAKFGASAVEAWFLFAIAATFYVAIVAIPAPVTLAILPPCLGVVFLALRKNRRQETRPNLLADLKAPVPWHRYVLVFLIPITSIGVYLLMSVIGHGLPTNWVVLYVNTPTGFALLAISLYKVFRRKDNA